MPTISCYDIQGRAISIDSESIQFCPAVYGILLENGQVLLMRHPQTGLWQPPGTILAPRDTPTKAIRNYFRQITGSLPILGSLVFVEDQYLVDEQNQAWHLAALYYSLEWPSIPAGKLANVTIDQKPEMVSLNELHRSQMQFGYEAVQAGLLRFKL